MSSKIEVSRELLEQLASPYTGLRNQAMYALRALLAAPVVERQPVDMQWQYEAGSVWWSFDTDNVGDNIASGTKIRLIDHAGTVLFKYPVPELAELQAKCELSDIRISQLTVAIDQSSKAQLENYHMATRAWTESKELQATIERLNGELQAATDLITAKRSVNRTLRNEIERLKAGQGEPVAKNQWDVASNPVLPYADSYRQMARTGTRTIDIWSIITDLERNIAPLYTSQPAPVSVALPERKDPTEHWPVPGGVAKAEGWNACLDKVKEMNQ